MKTSLDMLKRNESLLFDFQILVDGHGKFYHIDLERTLEKHINNRSQSYTLADATRLLEQVRDTLVPSKDVSLNNSTVNRKEAS